LRAGTTPDDTGETTMNTYTITSKAGQKMGEYTGRTEREALVAMHRDAGYPGVGYDAEADAIVWPDEDTADLCGSVRDWIVAPAETTPDYAALADEECQYTGGDTVTLVVDAENNAETWWDAMRAHLRADGNRTRAAQLLGVSSSYVGRVAEQYPELMEKYPARAGNPHDAGAREGASKAAEGLAV
jgi:hypothetical protein